MKLFSVVSIPCLIFFFDYNAFCIEYAPLYSDTSSKSSRQHKRSILSTVSHMSGDRRQMSPVQAQKEAESEQRLRSEPCKPPQRLALQAHSSDIGAIDTGHSSQRTSSASEATGLRPRHTRHEGHESGVGDQHRAQTNLSPFGYLQSSPYPFRRHARALNPEFSAGTVDDAHSARLPGQFWKSSKYKALLHIGGFGLAGAGIGAGFWEAKGTQDQAQAGQEGNNIQKAMQPTTTVSLSPSSSTSFMSSPTSSAPVKTGASADDLANMVQQIASQPTKTYTDVKITNTPTSLAVRLKQ